MMRTMANDARSRIVATGYDSITDAYVAWTEAMSDPQRAIWLDRFSARLPDDATVLELGRGSGGPSTTYLAERFHLVGVDISTGQIERARQKVPRATFVLADMRSVAFDAERFDGIVALYSIIHVPRDEHLALFARMVSWLKPGGWLLACLGAAEDADWTGRWLGVPMFFSSYDADTNLGLLETAGLTVEASEVATLHEPEPDGDAWFLWVLARRPMP